MTTNWLGALRHWLREQREQAEFARMSERERRDAGLSPYDMEWFRKRGPRRF